MTAEEIHTILLGNTRTFLVPGRDGYLLIDGGHRVWGNCFLRHLTKAGLQPQDIRMAVITHVHFDHVGTLQVLKKHCRCPVAVHSLEADLLASGQVVIPPGTVWPGKLVKMLTDWFPGLTARACAFGAVKADLLISDTMSLEDHGFDARIIPAPGHTQGSLSILTSAGNAFVGDIAVNMPILGRQRYASPFGYSAREMAVSMEKLIKESARRFYPAHGRPFDATQWQKKMLVQN